MKSGSGADTFLSVLGLLPTGLRATVQPIWVLGREDAAQMADVLEAAGHNAYYRVYQDTGDQVASRAKAAIARFRVWNTCLVIFFIDGVGIKIGKFYNYWDVKITRFKGFDRESATWNDQLAINPILLEIGSDEAGEESSLVNALTKAHEDLSTLESENPKEIGDTDASIKQMAEIIHNVLVQSYKDPEADASTPIARRIVPVGNAVAARITDFMIDKRCTVGFHHLEAHDVDLASLTRLGNEIMHADDNSVAIFLINNNAAIIAKVGGCWELQVIRFMEPHPINMTWAGCEVDAKQHIPIDKEPFDGFTPLERLVGMGLGSCKQKATN